MSNASNATPPTLEALATTCWQQLAAATDDPADPWRTPAIATCGGHPSEGTATAAVRTVVLREAQPAQRSLFLHTDARSAKAEALAQAPRLAWLFWDADRKVQLRCEGHVTLHTADAVAERHWARLGAHSRSNYLHRDAPGTVISDPRTAAERRDDEDTAFTRFLVVRCVIGCMDWLHLDRAGHERARLAWNGGRWDAHWVAP